MQLNFVYFELFNLIKEYFDMKNSLKHEKSSIYGKQLDDILKKDQIQIRLL